MSKDEAVQRAPYARLEWITGVVLVLVLAMLAWMVGAAYGPTWLEWATVEVEIVAVLGLLTVALALVSVLALLHTRR
jgi:hypothetical protein